MTLIFQRRLDERADGRTFVRARCQQGRQGPAVARPRNTSTRRGGGALQVDQVLIESGDPREHSLVVNSKMDAFI